MRATAKQVAAAAGVSLSAVSRAYSPEGSIDPEKKQRILAAAEALHYENPARRTAQLIAKDTVTLVAGDLLNPFYPLVLDILAQQLQSAGRQLLVYAIPADGNVDALTKQILAQRPSGIIVTSAKLTSNMAGACRQQGIKTVLLNRVQPDMRVHSITCDNYGGGREVARHLLSKGRKKIGFVGGIVNTSTHMERARGFRDAMSEAGKEIRAEGSGQYDYGVAYQAATELFRRKGALDALFCCNDIMALAAIDAARKRGMKVGEDVAIVGFDDIPMASWNSYLLTSMSQPVEKMVKAAIGVITNDAIGPRDDGSMQIFPGTLIKRKSG